MIAALMRALVTGGAGFIGSNIVDGLVEAGHEVTVVDNITTGRRENLDGAIANGVELVEADIRDAEAMVELCKRVKPDRIFHLAARIDVRRSIRDPAGDAETNVVGTINMLEAARQAEVGRFINTSTGGAIYGDTDAVPTPESQPPNPKAPYGMSKFCAERYCDLYARLHGVSTVVLRYGNVYGPRQDPLGEAGVMAIWCGNLLRGLQPTVFGDGEQTRDFAFVGDIAAANIAAAEADQPTGAYNIGRGQETSLLEVLDILRGLADGPFEPEHQPERKGEIRRSALIVDRAREELGWQAEVSVPEGIERTVTALREGVFADFSQ